MAGNWAVLPPGWQGRLPDGVSRIDAPSLYVWIIGRTQTNGPADYPTVHKIQDAFRLIPLSHWGGGAPRVTVSTDPGLDMVTPPLDQVNSMTAENFFDYGLGLMKPRPQHPTDWSLVAQMRRLGLAAGARFAGLEPGVRSALSDVPAAALQAMREACPRMARVVNGWQMNIDTIGVYGNFYLKRAVITMVGLGANSPEDGVYPILPADADRKPLAGDNDYVIHFGKDELPPGHWPGGQLAACAEGRLGITMRLYSPKSSVLTGTWAPPAVRRSA